MKCDGTEKHSHYMLATGQTFLHSHAHQVMSKEFNNLHHHPPIEHDNFTEEELTRDAETYEVPF